MRSAFWNIVYGLFFAALVLIGFDWLMRQGLFSRFVPILDLILIALAIFRLTRLATYDIITKFIRDAVGKAHPDSFVGTFAKLLNCPWCTALWFSFFVVFFYYALEIAWPIILVLALAGIASFVQVLSNLMGWHAEGKKREVLGSSNPSGSQSTCG